MNKTKSQKNNIFGKLFFTASLKKTKTKQKTNQKTTLSGKKNGRKQADS